jgi:hypothetical protein
MCRFQDSQEGEFRPIFHTGSSPAVKSRPKFSTGKSELLLQDETSAFVSAEAARGNCSASIM